MVPRRGAAGARSTCRRTPTGCDADPEKVACDYPPYHLNKIVSTKFADSGSPAVDLVKNFTWTNDDQNLVAKYIAEDKMDPEDAAAEVDRRQPGQGRRLAQAEPTPAVDAAPRRRGLTSRPGSGDP